MAFLKSQKSLKIYETQSAMAGCCSKSGGDWTANTERTLLLFLTVNVCCNQIINMPGGEGGLREIADVQMDSPLDESRAKVE